MNGTSIFLRHGQTKVDPGRPISEWVLTDEGHRQAQKAAENPELQDVDLIVVSTELKARETAEPLIQRLKAAGKKFDVIYSDQIAELNRDAGGHMDKETYENAVRESLSNRDMSVHNWETANHAFERFTTEVGRIQIENPNRKILFIGHGYTFGMYFAEREGKRESKELYDYVHKSTFCSWGYVKEGKVKWPLEPFDAERPGERMV